ncbi:triadin-like [Haliotis asinina]|uniref:triadin-like n=1 Tax=Haliotis asinina TaxID=109174 RepID=UPI0035322BAE
MAEPDDEDIKEGNGATGWAIKATCIVLAACLLCGAVFFIAKKYGFGKNQRQTEKKPPEPPNRNNPSGPGGQGQRKSEGGVDVESNKGVAPRKVSNKGVAPDVLPVTTKPLSKCTSLSTSLSIENENDRDTPEDKEQVNKKETSERKNDSDIRKNSKGSGCNARQDTGKDSKDRKQSGATVTKPKDEDDGKRKKSSILEKIKGDKNTVEAAVLGIMIPSDKRKEGTALTMEKKREVKDREDKTESKVKDESNVDAPVRKPDAKMPKAGKGTGLMNVVQLKVDKEKQAKESFSGRRDDSMSTEDESAANVPNKEQSQRTDVLNTVSSSAAEAGNVIGMTKSSAAESTNVTQANEQDTKKKTKTKARALSKAKAIGKMKMIEGDDVNEEGKVRKKKTKRNPLASPIDDLPTPTKKKIPELPESVRKKCPELPEDSNPIPDLPESVKNKPQWENPKQDPMKDRVPGFPNELPSRPQWVAPDTDPEKVSLPDLPDEAKSRPVWSDPLKGAPILPSNMLSPDTLPVNNRPAWNDPKVDPMKDSRRLRKTEVPSEKRPSSTYSASTEAYANGAQDRRGSNTSTTKSLPPLALNGPGEGGKKKGRKNFLTS